MPISKLLRARGIADCRGYATATSSGVGWVADDGRNQTASYVDNLHPRCARLRVDQRGWQSAPASRGVTGGTLEDITGPEVIECTLEPDVIHGEDTIACFKAGGLSGTAWLNGNDAKRGAVAGLCQCDIHAVVPVLLGLRGGRGENGGDGDKEEAVGKTCHDGLLSGAQGVFRPGGCFPPAIRLAEFLLEPRKRKSGNFGSGCPSVADCGPLPNVKGVGAELSPLTLASRHPRNQRLARHSSSGTMPWHEWVAGISPPARVE